MIHNEKIYNFYLLHTFKVAIVYIKVKREKKNKACTVIVLERIDLFGFNNRVNKNFH